MGNALALAVVPNICLYQTRLGDISNWKGLAGPNGSRNGLFAALLAREGITGPDEPFEGKAGLMKQLDNPFELGDFGGGTTPFKVQSTFFKSGRSARKKTTNIRPLFPAPSTAASRWR